MDGEIRADQDDTHVFRVEPRAEFRVVISILGTTEEGDFEVELAIAEADIPDFTPGVLNFQQSQPTVEGERGHLVVTPRGRVRESHLESLERNESLESVLDPRRLFLVLPEEPVGAGARWDVETWMPTVSYEAAVVTHELAALKGDGGRVTFAYETRDRPRLVTYRGALPLEAFEVTGFESAGAGELSFSSERLVAPGRDDVTSAMPMRARSPWRPRQEMTIQFSAEVEISAP